MTIPTTPAVPAGWYPDPEQAGAQRYWEGQAWTDQRRPIPAPIPPTIPAGWYPDPEQAEGQRYWDGQAWTDQRRPMAPPVGAAAVGGVPDAGTWPTAVPASYGYQAPAGSPGMYYDPESGLTLPQGVQLATVGRRIGAFFLAIPLAIGTLFIGYVIWGLIVWGRGQTPTQQVLKMRCWRPETNRNAGWGWMALREIIGGILESVLSIFTQVLSFILMVVGKERKCLRDHVAGTVVLHDPHNILGSPTPSSIPPASAGVLAP
jgi:uncharacterized RDD family membrane protein YckC